MTKTKRTVSVLLLAALLVPSLFGCKKSGISVGEASALMNELDSSGAISIENIEKEQAAAAAEAAAKKAEKEAEAAAAREAAKAALSGTGTSSGSKTSVTPKPAETEPKEPVVLKIDTPVEEVALDNRDLYAAPPFTPEVYDPNDTREFKILGAAYSDGDWAAVYGECPVGVTVTATIGDGKYSVQSEGGCFALRLYSPNTKPAVIFDLTYDGKPICDPITEVFSIGLSSFEDDESWSVWLGGGNQGFYYKMIPDYSHTNLMSDEVKANMKKKIAGRVENLQKIGDGCELIYVLAPASMTILTELVPDSIEKGEGDSRYDQLKEVLEEAGAKVIDLRPAFTARKNDSLPLYYNYDSHWTDYGSYIASVELFDYISDRYPAAKPRQFSEFTWDWGYFTRGDMPYYFDVDRGGLVYEHTFIRNMTFELPAPLKSLTRYKYADSVAYSSYTDEISGSGTYKTNREDLPDIFVYRNSYGASIFDLLIERSNRSYFNSMFTYTFNLSQIKNFDPDYVIYVVSEWDFGYLLDN